MKLAFVHKRFAEDGGTERVLASLARGLTQRGHEVVVFCAAGEPPAGAAAGLSLRPLLSRGPGSLLRALMLYASARLMVRRCEFDVVVHFGRTGPADIYRSGGGCHRHWFDLLEARSRGFWQRLRLRLSLKHRFLMWHEARALRSGARVIVPSQRSRQDLIAAYGAAAEAVTVVPNGVDLQRFHPRVRDLYFASSRETLGLAPEDRVLLFVASDYWRKGLDRVLAALGALAEQGQDLRLVVAGADRRQPMFEQMCEAAGLRQQVLFVGATDRPERLYGAADLLVLPTRYDPFANVSIEALACSLPVVTTASNGAAESLTDSAALAVIGDSAAAGALAAAITEMLDPGRWQERSRAAREVAQQFAEGLAVERWEHLLERVSSERRRCG